LKRLAQILDRLEVHYGKLEPIGPTDPYGLVLFLNCGYPASDENCVEGFSALRAAVGISVQEILDAPQSRLAKCLKRGGIFPELRAKRLKQIATIVQQDFGGDLRVILKQLVPDAKKVLKRFPTIGDPGAERILLFSGAAALPAVPANCLQVPLRLGFGTEAKSFGASYRSVQQALAAELPAQCAGIVRAYLLFRRHAQELCKRVTPSCSQCPVTTLCNYTGARR
jgi:endonuclease III